MHYTLSITLV